MTDPITLVILFMLQGDITNLTAISVKRFYKPGACTEYVKKNKLAEYVFDGRFKCVRVPKGWYE